MRTSSTVVVIACLLTGCAPFIGQTREPAYSGNGPGAIALPPLVVYQNSVGPLSYRSEAAGEGLAPVREVRGEACQSALTLPVGLVVAAIKSGNTALATAFLSGGWGEGGYAEAVSSASRSAPNARLVNVRADLNTRIILGIWRQQCVRVVASAVSAAAAPSPSPTN
jgi:hypothetical protein